MSDPASAGASTGVPRRPIGCGSGTAPTPATPKPAGLSDAELERAAQLEADLLAEEKAAEQSRKRTRERTAPREVVGTGGSLAAQEAAEYAYVARDVKDIVKIASLLLVVLLVLWILIDVAGIIPIGG